MRGMISITLSAGMLCAWASEPMPAYRLSPLAKGYIERARTMLDQGNYAGVIDQLRHLDTQGTELSASERENCAYLLALALYERGDADCVDALRDFAEAYPASPQALPARLAAADYFFFAHRFQSALAAYQEIDYARINPADAGNAGYSANQTAAAAGSRRQAQGCAGSCCHGRFAGGSDRTIQKYG